MPIIILTILQVFLVLTGVVSAVWGIYDMYSGDSGSQNSNGIKRLIGGLAFAVLVAIVFTYAKNQIKDIEQSITPTSCIRAYDEQNSSLVIEERLYV